MVTGYRGVCFLIKLQAKYLCNLQHQMLFTHNIDSFADGSGYITCIILLDPFAFLFGVSALHFK